MWVSGFSFFFIFSTFHPFKISIGITVCIFCLSLQDLYKVTPAFEILTKSNTQVQPTSKPGVPVDSKYRHSYLS